MFKIYFIFLLLTISVNICAQNDSTSKDVLHGMVTANMLPIHPLGIYTFRIVQNFKTQPPNHFQLNASMSNGNIWLPQVITYKPTDKSIQDYMLKTSWYSRHKRFDPSIMNAEKMTFLGDGVLLEFRADLNFGFCKNHEIGVGVRSYRLNGVTPYSIITSDKFIEFFHAKLMGISDPFGRKNHQYNQAAIQYIDENNHAIEVAHGTSFIPGFELNYYYYLPYLKDLISINLGVHSGFNLSKFYKGIENGVSTSVVKDFEVMKHQFTLALGGNLVQRQSNNTATSVKINDKQLMYGFETAIEYKRYNKKYKFWNALGINYYYESPYLTGFSPQDDYKYLVFVGNQEFRDWYLTSGHLFESIQTFRFIYSFTKKRLTISYYLEQDFKLNNAPDFQTGFAVIMR